MPLPPSSKHMCESVGLSYIHLIDAYHTLPSITVPECLLGENVTAFQDLFTRFSDLESCFKDSITLESGKDHPILHNEELLLALEHLIQTQVTTESRDFLAVFLRHLRRISLNEAVNKMGLNNLQVVWSPTLRFGGRTLC